MMLKSTLFIFSFLLLGSAFSAETKLSVDNKSGKIEYQISENLPKGDYKIWNLTKDTDVGLEIHKKAAGDASGKITINSNAFDDKFALLDADGLTVYTLEVETPKTEATAAVLPTSAPVKIQAPEEKIVAKEILKEEPKKSEVKSEVKPEIKEDPKVALEISTAPTTLSEEAPADTVTVEESSATSVVDIDRD